MKNLSFRHSRRASETLWAALKRVSLTLGVNPRVSNQPDYADVFRWNPPEGRESHLPLFVPAGRTIRTANPESGTVEPNCTVSNIGHHPLLHEQVRRATILSRTTGIGGNLDALPVGMTPAAFVSQMNTFGSQPPADPSGRRPGLLFTMSSSHPLCSEFIAYKRDFWDSRREARSVSEAPMQMNVSVSVSDKDLSRETLFPIAEAAHACGDPGLLFPDRCPMEPSVSDPSVLVRARATSPCGELWLHHGEYCNLGNMVLPAFVNKSLPGGFDWDAFEPAVRAAVTFLDTVLDHFPDYCKTPELLFYRRIGLGVMGWATMLKDLDVPYDSPEARTMASHLARVMKSVATDQSEALARERGSSLPPLPRTTFRGAPAAQRRNVTVLALAPTGGTSFLFPGMSASIEPLWEEAHDISPAGHLEMVEAWQRYVDNGVSKTINLKADASVESVVDAYEYAHKLGLRGVTIFRDGCLSHTGIGAPISCATGGTC